MSKAKKLIPELRFPEFVNQGRWVENTLGQVVTFSKGKGISKGDIVENGKFKCIRYGELYTVYGETISEVFSSTDVDLTDLVLSEENDVLIPSSGETQVDIAKASCLLMSGIALGGDINILKSVINGVFLSYYLNGAKKGEIARMSQGISVVHLYSSQLQNLTITYPLSKDKSNKEQQKIASCLSSLDELITAYSTKLETLKDHKKGLMQNLFPQEGKKAPKYRFPEFENDGEWVKEPLINTAHKNTRWSFTGGPFGSNLKTSDYTESGFRIILLQNIGEGEFKNEYKIYTSLEKADELLSCNIYGGDIILSKMGDPVGRACIIPEDLKRCVMASDGIRLVVDEKKYSKYFIFSLINSKQIRKAIERKATGSTRKRIGLNDLKDVQLNLPKNQREQQTIASCLSEIDELITAQKEKIVQLQLHKKGLMQGLFPECEN